METQELYRGRLFDHVQLVVEDVPASRRFYQAVFEVLEIPLGGEADDYFWYDELFISSKESKAALGAVTGRVHLAFQGKSREVVDRFYRAALAAGGRDNGAPGERAYHPGYYAAFVLDTDDNNIEVVYHGEAKRSTPAVKITF
jgi:catechol 2,3-dioxygenase-like lactoylglutathione lyase family enzyme